MERYVLRGADAARYILFEPLGLRIQLPRGCAQQRPSIGVALIAPVHGDFDISVRFDLLKEPDPDDNAPNPTRATMSVLVDAPERIEAAVSRRMAVTGATQFYAFVLSEEGAAAKAQPKIQTVPTAARTGRLRLVRKDSAISCFASAGEAENYFLLGEYPFSARHVKQVFLNGSTGGAKADLDVRFSDLRIVATSLPDLSRTGGTKQGSKSWLLTAVIVNALLVCAALISWLVQRRRGTARATRDKDSVAHG